MRRANVSSIVRFITTLFIFAAAALAAAVPAAAQAAEPAGGRLRLDALERLAPRASESVNIEIDNFLIRFAGAILSDEDPEEQAVKEVIAGLKGVYVRSYEFKAEGQFSEADVRPVREQLRAPGWSRILQVDSRGLGFGDAEIYVASAAGRVEGLALLVVEPRELTVINIVGAIDLAKLKRIGESLNLPGIRIERKKSTQN